VDSLVDLVAAAACVLAVALRIVRVVPTRAVVAIVLVNVVPRILTSALLWVLALGSVAVVAGFVLLSPAWGDRLAGPRRRLIALGQRLRLAPPPPPAPDPLGIAAFLEACERHAGKRTVEKARDRIVEAVTATRDTAARLDGQEREAALRKLKAATNRIDRDIARMLGALPPGKRLSSAGATALKGAVEDVERIRQETLAVAEERAEVIAVTFHRHRMPIR
jgi:hypothetical protein